MDHKTGEETKEGEQGRMTILRYFPPSPVMCHVSGKRKFLTTGADFI